MSKPSITDSLRVAISGALLCAALLMGGKPARADCQTSAESSGAWRSVGRALARIPKQEADQAREAQLARLQAVRMLLWNQASADPIRAAEALIKLEAPEARLLGLDMPTKVAVTDPVARFPQTFFVPSRQRKTEGRGSDVVGRLGAGTGHRGALLFSMKRNIGSMHKSHNICQPLSQMSCQDAIPQ